SYGKMPILESASSSLSERRLKQAQHRSSTLPAASSSAHTRHMKALLTAQQISKTDRNDARGIAQMMRVGLFKPVHVKTADCPGTANAADQPQAAGRGIRFARHAAQFWFESGRRRKLSIRGAGARARRGFPQTGSDRRAAAQRPPGHAPAVHRPAQDAAD